VFHNVGVPPQLAQKFLQLPILRIRNHTRVMIFLLHSGGDRRTTAF
jgi:hypothetical protein